MLVMYLRQVSVVEEETAWAAW